MRSVARRVSKAVIDGTPVYTPVCDEFNVRALSKKPRFCPHAKKPHCRCRQSSGWTWKANCPFHKGGNEKIPSFYINPTFNRFYCQGCAATGSVVEFISKKYKRSAILVAEHILQCTENSAKIDYDKLSRIKERERFEKSVLMLSDMCRNFVKNNINGIFLEC